MPKSDKVCYSCPFGILFAVIGPRPNALKLDLVTLKSVRNTIQQLKMREQTVRKYGLVYYSQANQCETQCQSEPYINKEYSPTNEHELSLILFEKIRLYR